jgi:hypothetical protein
MTQTETSNVARLLPLVRYSNFISFEEITKALGLSLSEIITLKLPLEEALRQEDDKIRVTYRTDPIQGFQID